MANLTVKDKALMNINTKLTSFLKSKTDALPKNFNKTRFLQNCMTVLQDTYKIETADPTSIARTMMKGAFLGLDFFNKECYAIVHGNKVEFQTDYKGEIKLAKKYSQTKIKNVYAKIVRVGDEYQEEITNGIQSINFKPVPFNDGEIIGAFAVCLFQDGSMIYDSMSIKEIEYVRNTYSKAKNGYAWVKSKGEMYKKVVLRRLLKLVTLDFDNVEQEKAFDESSGFEFNNKEKQEVKAISSLDLEDDVIDIEVEEENESR